MCKCMQVLGEMCRVGQESLCWLVMVQAKVYVSCWFCVNRVCFYSTIKFYLIFSCETKNQINKKVVNLGFIVRRWRDFIHLTELSIQMKSRNEIDYRYYIHRSYRSLNRPSQGTFIGGGHTAGVTPPPTDTRQLKFCLKTLVRKSTGLRNSVK